VATGDSRAPWWRGQRGEWYVVVQVGLFALVVLGPRSLPGWPSWPMPYSRVAMALGLLLMAWGALLAAAALMRLGQNDSLTALPYPRDEGRLVESGPYGLVRHPIYSGLISGAFGYALWVNGWLTLVYAALLFAFFDVKSRREERWLAERFSDYVQYSTRVRKLVPWIY
jgi:protein-S-isoprenylcysteine O-methyltransferase Ste14